MRRDQFSIEIPPLPLLNSNQRLHYYRKARATAAIRKAAFIACRNALGEVSFDRIHVLGILNLDSKRRADPANWYPSFKAAIDGLVDAGLIPDDNSRHLEGPDMRRGPVSKWPRLILVITPLSDGEVWPDFGDVVKVSIEGDK